MLFFGHFVTTSGLTAGAVFLSTAVRAAAFPVNVTPPQFPERTFRVTDYGATADGRKCTAAFAAAVGACAKAGGGHVVVPKGTWYTGPVHLKSNVDLHFEEGAILDFSDDPADCLPAVPSTWEGVECLGYSPLLYAYCCTNVAVTGKGLLRPRMGLWRKWFDRGPGGERAMRALYKWCCEGTPLAARDVTALEEGRMRPHLIQFNRSERILLDGFTIRESPFWTIHLFLSGNATVRGLDVRAKGSNNDGIDIEMSHDVLVEGCRFDQGDDGFVFKSGRNHDAWRLGRPTENVIVRNCHVEFAHSLLGVGSELSGGVRNILVEDCTVGTTWQFFYVKTNRRRGGVVDNITLRNVKAGKLTSVMRVETDILYQWRILPTVEERLTAISNLTVENVSCDEAKWGVAIWGDRDRPVEGVRVRNVHIGKVTKELCIVSSAKDVKIDGLVADELPVSEAGSTHRGH